MTTTFSNLINPLLLKELRQFVRNRFIVVLINLYVLAIVIACLFAFEIGGWRNVWEEVGKYIFFALANTSLLVGIVAVVIRTVWTTSIEKVNEDLMFYSSMTPATIVLGKIASGIILTSLLMSITFPFVTLAYLLRGIDIEAIFIVMAVIFIVIQVLNSFAVFVSALNRLKYFPFLSTLVVAAGSFPVYFGSVAFFLTTIYSGSLDYREVACPILFLAGSLMTLFVCGAIAMFSPPTSNRMFYVRILLTAIFVLSVLGAYFEIFASPADLAYEVIETICLLCLPFILLMIACERDQWSIRIRKNLPKSLIFRFLLFPFYTGAACGIVWILFMLAVIVMLDLSVGNGIAKDWQIYFRIGTFVFAFDYCVTAMLIRSWCFKKLNSACTAFVTLFLLFAFTLGSLLVFLLLALLLGESGVTLSDPLTAYSQNVCSALNPFCDTVYFNSPARSAYQYSDLRIAGMFTWLCLLILPLVIWFKRQLQNFNPNLKEIINYEEARKIAQDSEK
ncbi:MAG: hypothetical protein LBJ00_06425 [Planctomycetaceae bacterium]|jgi:hypothetical protein|nr:hypothetical protein [Planctomycetaceae bacterium]